MSRYKIFRDYMEDNNLQDYDFQVLANSNHTHSFVYINIPLTKNAAIRISLLIKEGNQWPNEECYIDSELFELLYSKYGIKPWDPSFMNFNITKAETNELRELKELNKYSYRPNDKRKLYKKIEKITNRSRRQV